MLQTYKAILQGNRLEWCETAPQSLHPDQPIVVHVTILDDVPTLPPLSVTGLQMAAILEQLAQHPTLSTIQDPVTWQREQRSDRELPGRED